MPVGPANEADVVVIEEEDEDFLDDDVPSIGRQRSAVEEEYSDDEMDFEGGGVKVAVEEAKQETLCVNPWEGTVLNTEPTEAPKNDPSPPAEDLELEWAYGYAGSYRSNVFYNADREIVYPLAALNVIYDSKAHTQRYFKGHNDDVISLAQSPVDKNVFASGQVATIIDGMGTKPHICVFDTSDEKKTVTIPLCHERAVRTVGFNLDGTLLASVGDDDKHTVKVWDVATGEMVAELAAGGGGPASKGAAILQVVWSNKAKNEFCTVGIKHCYMWSLEGNKLTKKAAKVDSPNLTFYSCTYSASGKACCGSSNGCVYVFAGTTQKAKFQEHNAKGKVFSLDAFDGGLVSGGSDKLVNVYNMKMKVTNSFKFPSSVQSVYIDGDDLLVGCRNSNIYQVNNFAKAGGKLPKPIVYGHFAGEVWGLAVENGEDATQFTTVGEDNKVCLWDMESRTLKSVAKVNVKRGPRLKVRRACTMSKLPPNQMARAIDYSPDNSKVIIGTNQGEVVVYETKTMKEIARQDLNKYGKRNVKGQVENWIQTIRFSPSGLTVAVGTHGFVICLLDAQDGFKCKGKLTAHNASPTHIDWSTDSCFLRSNCMAYELLFHDVDENALKSSKQHTSAVDMKDVEWATCNCIFSWPVQGIFRPDQDGTDVNFVDKNPDASLLVTGDDDGMVSLFRYPCTERGVNEPKTFAGHSSHVPNVRFTPNGQRVLSAGGNDRSILQWRVVGYVNSNDDVL